MHEIKRPYSASDVQRLQGSYEIPHFLAARGAQRLRFMLKKPGHIKALGAMTGGQAVQMVKAGLQAIYLSGWQVAADANTAGQTYPDQSLYPVDSVPTMVRRINNALLRADQIQTMEAQTENKKIEVGDYLAPIVADAEAGFGGPLNVFELTKALIEAGAAAVHLEDQLSSEKKCGHLGGKVLIPASQHIRSLVAARLASDVMRVPTVIIARTDAGSAQYLTSDVDLDDYNHIEHEDGPNGASRMLFSKEGFYKISGGLEMAIQRGLAYAPYADVLWMETSTPDVGEAREFAQAIHEKFPDIPLAYNCSPSFNWKAKLREYEIAEFQENLALFGYRFQFITLAGFHSLNHGMFELARDYVKRGMSAYADFQVREMDSGLDGYTAYKHQREVGVGYFDQIMQAVSGGESSTVALGTSTEAEQFK